MDLKKLLVGLVAAVSLMLFTGAVYAQQPAATQEGKTPAPVAHQEEHGGEHGGTHEHHGHA